MKRTGFAITLVLGAWLLLGAAPTRAQDHSSSDHGQHTTHAANHEQHKHSATAAPQHQHGDSAMDYSEMDHSKKNHSGNEPAEMDHSGMDKDSMQGGSAPPDARDPDYSDGIRFQPDNDAHMMGTARYAMLLVDRLEYFDTGDEHGAALDAEGWYGGDLDKLWWKLEGEHAADRLEDYRAEALWSHAISAYFDTQLGLRHDGGAGPARNWAAFGIQGLAPYWFEVSATAYVGQGGRTAARFEAEYEILLTQRLILQPKLELSAYGKDDPARGIGSGLSDASVGLRLRYEIRRRFAPYLGIQWQHRFGGTAELARQSGAPVSEHQWVAGVRFWF